MDPSLSVQIDAAVRAVEDPELPVTISDLGMVRSIDTSTSDICIRLVPSFIACTARWMIERDVCVAAKSVTGVQSARVEWEDGGWTIADVSPAGREALASVGVGIPNVDGGLSCPHCGSSTVEQTSLFGSAVCRSSAFCEVCRTPFEVLKTKKSLPSLTV